MLSPASFSVILFISHTGRYFAMPTTTKPASKKTSSSRVKKRTITCGLCNKKGHNKAHCPLKPKEEEKQLELIPHKLVVQSGVKTGPNGEALEGEVLRKCKRRMCRHIVDETGYGEFCTMTCAFFERKRVHEEYKSKDKYQPTFATESLTDYLIECERSHLPMFAKVEETLIPVKRTQIPSVAGFATYLGFAKITLKSWANKYSEFRKAMLLLKQVQEYYLTNYGGTGMYTPVVVKLMLMNNHGMKDRSERTVNHLFGIVREVYEQADAYEQDGALDDPFEGMLGDGANEDEDFI